MALSAKKCWDIISFSFTVFINLGKIDISLILSLSIHDHGILEPFGEILLNYFRAMFIIFRGLKVFRFIPRHVMFTRPLAHRNIHFIFYFFLLDLKIQCFVGVFLNLFLFCYIYLVFEIFQNPSINPSLGRTTWNCCYESYRQYLQDLSLLSGTPGPEGSPLSTHWRTS